MECLLSDNTELKFDAFELVLILILMECLLRKTRAKAFEFIEGCLNPYSNGMLT